MNIKHSLGTVCLALGLMASQASAISLTPATPTFATGVGGGQSDIDAIINGLLSPDPAVVYKATQSGGAEEGSAQAFYNTTFGIPTPQASATIAWNGLSYLTGTALYALIKDGNLAWYFYDISTWNGKDVIEFSNYYGGNQGKISHVSLYGGTLKTPGTNGGPVPDGGATMALLGLSLLGMTAVRKAMAQPKA